MATHTTSKFHRIHRMCLRLLAEHEGKPDIQFPSVREIARRHKVSTITASKVISNLIAQGFLVKREGVGTYVAPRRMGGGRVMAHEVALCLGPTTFSVFFLELFAELNKQARERGYKLSVFGNPGPPTQDQTRVFIQEALNEGYQTLAVGPIDPATVVAVEDLLRDVPQVVLFGSEEATSFDTVSINVYRGSFLAGKYFAQMGHRDILLMKPHLPARWKGFLAGLCEEGVELPEHLIFPSDGSERSGYDLVNCALRSGLKFSGVMTCSDESTLGAVFALRGAGLVIPRDVSIIAFGDAGPIRTICPVTSISVRPEELARRTWERLEESLTRKGRDNRHCWIEPILVDRGSVKKISGEPLWVLPENSVVAGRRHKGG
jgi:LacI family transcriptional regulator, purine nucleotide synthesis repressor